VDAVADVDEERLKRVCDMYPGLRGEQDYQLLLRDPSIDAVVIATPVSTHFKIARESVLAGKHVLCEKPLCKSSKQGQELVELARTKERLLVVGHTFLFNPGIMKLKELVSTSQLGTIRYLLASRTNLGVFQTDVNVSYDLCSHDISIFNWLLGNEPEVVSAVGASNVQPGIEDVVFVSMKYPNNTIANMHAS
jgi:predicted dehydrogenase